MNIYIYVYIHNVYAVLLNPIPLCFENPEAEESYTPAAPDWPSKLE